MHYPKRIIEMVIIPEFKERITYYDGTQQSRLWPPFLNVLKGEFKEGP